MRRKIFEYIAEHCQTAPEYLWTKLPDYAVFRHQSNQKWFALIAAVPSEKLHLSGAEGLVWLINLKLNPDLIDVLKNQRGFLPAYHMNKRTWISVLLDGSVEFDELKKLIDESFALTAPRVKAKQKS